LRPNSWCEIILQSKKRITFMLLIIDKCLMAIELSPKGRNLNITPQPRTLLKRGRIILVVVCKRTFLDWFVWFRNYVTITFVIFRRGGLEINLERFLNNLPILSKNCKKSMGLPWSLYPLIYPYVRVIHRSIEIQALCLREKRHIVFPCDDLGSMILWEVS
jgi:hypothetical protein